MCWCPPNKPIIFLLIFSGNKTTKLHVLCPSVVSEGKKLVLSIKVFLRPYTTWKLSYNHRKFCFCDGKHLLICAESNICHTVWVRVPIHQPIGLVGPVFFKKGHHFLKKQHLAGLNKVWKGDRGRQKFATPWKLRDPVTAVSANGLKEHYFSWGLQCNARRLAGDWFFRQSWQDIKRFNG